MAKKNLTRTDRVRKDDIRKKMKEEEKVADTVGKKINMVRTFT